LGFGLLTFCNAKIRSGFDVVAKAIDLRARISRADIVITGEGKLDRQTLAGKGPAGVARLARELGKPVYAIVGAATDDSEVRQLFDDIFALNDASPNYHETPRLLEIRAKELASRLR
jgi:glycerate kinase